MRVRACVCASRSFRARSACWTARGQHRATDADLHAHTAPGARQARCVASPADTTFSIDPPEEDVPDSARALLLVLQGPLGVVAGAASLTGHCTGRLAMTCWPRHSARCNDCRISLANRAARAAVQSGRRITDARSWADSGTVAFETGRYSPLLRRYRTSRRNAHHHAAPCHTICRC